MCGGLFVGEVCEMKVLQGLLSLGDGVVTLLRSSERKRRCLQGLKPLPVFCRPYGTIFVLFHKTFWAAPRDNK